MISLLTCCKTHQSVIEKSTVIAKDTTTISQVATRDSNSLNTKIDSIIIEEYAAHERGTKQTTEGRKVSSYRKGNDISQNKTGSMKKKTKIYGINLSGTWSTTRDSLNKKMTHHQTTNSEIKQKTPTKSITGGNNVYAIAVIGIALFIGYLIWKNAVQ